MFIPAGKHLSWILLTFTHLINTVTVAQPDFRYYVCGDGGNYTRNSTYRRNLDAILSDLPFTNSGLGFFNLSGGQGNNRVNSAALCQGDMEPDLCRTCLNDSIIKLRKVCPNQKEAVGYYGRCLLKYSDAVVTGNIQTKSSGIVVHVQSASDKDKFIGALDSLMDELKAAAAAGGSLLKFATGNTTASDFATIYGLVQCTPDLSGKQCSDCLKIAHDEYVTSGFHGRMGGTMFLPMCRYSYDIQRFFDGTTLLNLAPPLPRRNLQATPPVYLRPPPPPRHLLANPLLLNRSPPPPPPRNLQAAPPVLFRSPPPPPPRNLQAAPPVLFRSPPPPPPRNLQAAPPVLFRSPPPPPPRNLQAAPPVLFRSPPPPPPRNLQATPPVLLRPPPPPNFQAIPPVLSAPPPPLPPGIRLNIARSLIIVIIVIVTFGVIIIASICIFLKTREKKQKPMPLKDNDDETMDINNAESLKYNFSVVRAATNNFSENNKLGQGGFGAVYKGVFADGREIAVKRLARDSRQGEVEFKMRFYL
ncbi:hypothetical protein R6Q59_004557 [Mikania micrantha]